MIQVIKNRKIPFAISSVLFGVSIVILSIIGLKPGIDFTGGSLIEVSFTQNRPAIDEIQEALVPLDFGNIVVQPTEEDGMILKMRYITEDEHQQVLSALKLEFEQGEAQNVVVEGEGIEAVVADTSNKVYEERIETIGPAISSQLRSRAFKAAFVVILAIIMYVAYAFRKVSAPVESWKYGVTAIIALLHDVVITMAIFALLGKYLGVEVDIPFVVALLTILGYSVNDTIVVFDRVRENLIKRGTAHFDETVNLGVNQTFMRSINTSITTLVVMAALFIFGGASIHYFSLALIVGIILGTYSSLFLASPLLVVWQKMK
jgi:preprotein translocase subunit SecF